MAWNGSLFLISAALTGLFVSNKMSKISSNNQAIKFKFYPDLSNEPLKYSWFIILYVNIQQLGKKHFDFIEFEQE